MPFTVLAVLGTVTQHSFVPAKGPGEKNTLFFSMFVFFKNEILVRALNQSTLNQTADVANIVEQIWNMCYDTKPITKINGSKAHISLFLTLFLRQRSFTILLAE